MGQLLRARDSENPDLEFDLGDVDALGRYVVATFDEPTYNTLVQVLTALQTMGSDTDLLTDIKRAVTDFETRLDYDVRTDGNPVYVGKALDGTATSATAWTVQRLTYDVSGRLTRSQVRTGIAWDNRATGWS